MLYGVDLYSGQGVLSTEQWRRLHQEEGVCYAICKATGEGAYFNGTYFTNRDNVRRLNQQLGYHAIIWGSYDWFEPSMAGMMSGQAAALDYLSAIGPRDTGHLLMVDFESPIWNTGPLGRNIEAYCREYFMTLSEESGQMVGVYYGPYFPIDTGANRWAWLGDTSRFYAWVAAPGKDQQLPNDTPWPGDTLAMPLPEVIIHQHQWHTRFAATGGTEWDGNRFRGSAPELLVYGNRGGDAVVQQTKVTLPPDGKWSEGITEDGVPYIIWNMGGKTTGFDGIAIRDMGASVLSFTEPGMILDRSIQDNVVHPYGHPRPKI